LSNTIRAPEGALFAVWRRHRPRQNRLLLKGDRLDGRDRLAGAEAAPDLSASALCSVKDADALLALCCLHASLLSSRKFVVFTQGRTRPFRGSVAAVQSGFFESRVRLPSIINAETRQDMNFPFF